MSKKKKIIGISIILLLILGVVLYRHYTNEDKLTSLNISEKTWIEKNKNELVDISLFSNMPILSYDGNGIIFDFLESLEKNTGLSFNKVPYTLNSNVKTDYAFIKKSEYNDKDILLFTDNYVLVTKNNIKYNSVEDISNLTIGVVNQDLEKINTYIKGNNIKYKTYDNFNNMLNEFKMEKTELQAISVPKSEYLDVILNNDYTISYNIEEYKMYYVIQLGNISKLNSILTKYYKKWANDNYNQSYSSQLLNNYFTFSNKSEQDKSKFKSKEYIYGFVENAPYDAMFNNKLYGINNSIMHDFVNLTKIKIKYIEYKTYEELLKAFNANEIDFYMNSSSLNEYKVDIYNTLNIAANNLVVISPYSNMINVNTLYSLKDYEVATIKNSTIEKTLLEYGLNVKTYNDIKSLVKSKSNIIVTDLNTYNYYRLDKLKKYKVDYMTNHKGYSYTFRNINDNTDFAQFFDFYLSYIASKDLVTLGISNIVSIDTKILILPVIGKILLGIIILVLIGYLLYRFNPKNIKKRHNSLSKEDKLKYIDMLTSLKNRNYLNDNIENWDNAEVYPQTIIVVDLNDLAYINDNYGHAQGDKIIKDAANILIKNQLNNTEIIRTSGNEFLIYMVSYDEKQILSFIKKLNKEFKELEYGFGAAIGYSIINDAIKSIDDAINEATIDMRSNKEEANG